MRSSSGRAVELLLVVSVLALLVLLSLQSAGTQVRGALARAEQSQAALNAAALEQERTVNALVGEQVLVAQVPDGLPETPAVRAGRALVAATDVDVPPLHVPAALLAAALVLRGLHRRRDAARRRAALRRSTVLSAFSPGAARCGAVSDRGTALLPVR